jgi:putative SOS response-associated peptidase YedK
MCGRYVSVRSSDDLLAEFDAVDATGGQGPQPDWNVAPTKPVRVVLSRRQRDDEGNPVGEPVRQLRVVTWGLVPSWAKDPSVGSRLINARVESVADKPAFRRAYSARRCLIPNDGWYEWRAGDGPRKQPFYMTAADGHPLAFAGLYEFWGENGRTLTTCTILTAPAAGPLRDIHDRMPLLLPRRVWAGWLDPAVADPSQLLPPWDEAGGEHLELRPVADTVNDVRHNGPSLVEPVSEPVQPQTLF